MKGRLRLGLSVLLLGTLSCEPVIAIGWKELSFVLLLMAILFGPPLYRFIRRVDTFREQKKKDK